MSRIDRRLWTEDKIGFKSSGGIFDLIDNNVKVSFRITDDEYDYLCVILSDEETDLLMSENLSFSKKRQIIHLLNKHISYENIFMD